MKKMILELKKGSRQLNQTTNQKKGNDDMTNQYCLIRNLPVWKFFYKGTHSKPVRTTLAVTEIRGDIVKGYVLRRGNQVFSRLQDAPIKSFRKSEIATVRGTDSPTLSKHTLTELIVNGA
jgi:hypothetical protein